MFLLILLSLIFTPASAHPVSSCTGPIYGVQEDEIYVDEAQVHSGNLKSPTTLRYSLYEFDEVSELTNPAMLGVPNAEADTMIEARLITRRKGKDYQGVSRTLSPLASGPLTGEYEGKKIAYRAFDTGSTLLSLFRDSAAEGGDYKLELTVSTPGKKCSVLVPLRVD